MPRNLSAWLDSCIHLAVILLLVFVISSYNFYIGAIGLVIWVCMLFFSRERCRARKNGFTSYCQNIIRNVNDVSNYAVERLPQAVLIVDADGRLQWFNRELEKYLSHRPEIGISIKDFWPGIILTPIWGTEGEYVFAHEGTYYKVFYRPVSTVDDMHGLMALYISDTSNFEQLKRKYQLSRTVLSYIQIDNYDEVLQGITDAERTSLIFEANRLIDEWLHHLGGFLRRVSDDLYIAVMTREGLDHALAEKFDILDKIRSLHSTNRLPVTLSMGIAVAETQSMDDLGSQAQAGLDLALGRGGDQVAVQIDGKTQFYGGKAKAVEKHTRVKARVVAHAISEIISNSDEVFIMGHHNEDFDCLGAAMGVAKMARQLKKPVHIILSDMNEGIDKFTDLLRDKETYTDLFLPAKELVNVNSLNPVLFVVDTHIPHLVAAPGLLDRIPQIIVIDHHRRSEQFIQNPLLVYIEPASSSTSELVTELLMYFSDDLVLSRVDATALYSGIVVDTKNFAVQTGVRTFDAAAYLRRSGADPVMVRHLFRTDYETNLVLSRAKASSELFDNGLIVTTIPNIIPNIQATAAQVADSLLRIENVRMSLVVFQLTADTIGISARSTGEINVQVIMEAFGGGGHQNVAGAQVQDKSLEEVCQQAVSLSKKYIEENDNDESNLTTGY